VGVCLLHCQCSKDSTQLFAACSNLHMSNSMLPPCVCCRCFNKDSCLGGRAAASRNVGTVGTDYKTALCAEPYTGNLCGSCKKGFGQVQPFVCKKCWSAAAIWALYLVSVVVMVVLVKLLVFFTTKPNNKAKQHQQQQHPAKSSRPLPPPAELLKVLVLHSQVLFIMSNLVGVPWPQALSYPLSVIGGIWASASGSSVGFDCILNQQGHGLPAAFQKVLICLLTPVGILLAVLLIEVAMRYLRPRSSVVVGHDFASVVMCIIFMFLPAWVSTALSLFACVPLDDPDVWPYQAESVGRFWVQDMSIPAFQGRHRGWALGLGIPLTLLFCLVLPVATFTFMWVSRSRGRLADADFQQRFGFLYRLWRDEMCWWEAVVVLQTVALVMVTTFGFVLGAFYQCIVTAAILVVLATLLLVARPFRCAGANTVAVVSVWILFATAYTALTFLPYDNAGPGPVYTNIMGAVILVANVGFLLAATWKLLRAQPSS